MNEWTQTQEQTLVCAEKRATSSRKQGPRNFAGNKTNETNVISVYPNPAKDELILKTETTGTIKITDVTGRIIIEREINSISNKVSLKSITPGYYLLSFYAKEGWNKSVRFAVAK